MNVLNLKTRIQELHEAKPEPKDQKLLYKGSYLSDDRVLSEVVSQEDSGFKFYLVLAQRTEQPEEENKEPQAVQAMPP